MDRTINWIHTKFSEIFKSNCKKKHIIISMVKLFKSLKYLENSRHERESKCMYGRYRWRMSQWDPWQQKRRNINIAGIFQAKNNNGMVYWLHKADKENTVQWYFLVFLK